MTALIVAFAAGVLALQQQADLPSLIPQPQWLLAVVACLPFALAKRIRNILFVALAFAAGFGWAAINAQLRMADRLAPELEGRDLVIAGVVSSLPAIGERSVRFEFEIEGTPGSAVRV